MTTHSVKLYSSLDTPNALQWSEDNQLAVASGPYINIFVFLSCVFLNITNTFVSFLLVAAIHKLA